MAEASSPAPDPSARSLIPTRDRGTTGDTREYGMDIAVMWQDFGNAMGLGLVLAILAFAVARISVTMGERSIERRHGRVGLKKMFIQRAKMERDFEIRRDKRMKEIAEVEREIRELFVERQRLERSLNAAKAASERLVRLIGEETEGTPCFVGKVLNKYVGVGPAQMRGPYLVDRIWAQGQEMEVWTRNVGEARAEIERRFPPAFGFVITRLTELGVQDDGKPEPSRGHGGAS